MNWKMIGISSVIGTSLFLSTEWKNEKRDQFISMPEEILCYATKGCVFRTLFGEEHSLFVEHSNTPMNVQVAVDNGLKWMIKAQQTNGGWGAGSHYRQDIMDPLAVNTDPATTAMVAMALLRTGSRLNEGGEYSGSLKRALEYLLMEVEGTPDNRLTITDQTGTQIQTKLGVNIDAVLTMQFFTNMLEYLTPGSVMHARVMHATNSCADKIQQLQSEDGSMEGSGWAGVLQSSLATNALEAAEYYGADIDAEKLERSREFQKSNYNTETGAVNTAAGAGVVLYSVSGSVRASAKQARKVKEEITKAQRSGELAEVLVVNEQVLMDMGYEQEEAAKLATSYNVYESSKDMAQSDNVISGFGNNGGEEFLSFLQTGESLIINDDEGWKEWFDATSSRLLDIQNQDGSWNGHHCITSPVFCTATTLLILSINADSKRLKELGRNN